MTCRGKCPKFKASRPATNNGARYANGQRRCVICDIFLNYEGLWCPCCGCRLRTKPRNFEYKAKLRGQKVEESKPNRKSLVGFTTDGKPILEDIK